MKGLHEMKLSEYSADKQFQAVICNNNNNKGYYF